MRPRHTALALLILVAFAGPTRGQVTLHEETFDHDAEHPAAGTWIANYQTGGIWQYATFAIRHEAGHWFVTTTLPWVAAVGSEATDVVVEERSISFTAAGLAGKVSVRTEISEDGQAMEGTAALSAGGPPVEGPLLGRRTIKVMQTARPMVFTGQVDVEGMMILDMTYAFGRTPDGHWIAHVDVPAQVTYGFILADVARDDRTITATLPGPVPALLNVELSEDERRITGTLAQGAYTLAVDFERNDGYVDSELRRPQHPKPPYPYGVREVTIEHPAGHELAGTITMPEGPGPFPAAILISGSGPQDRDESLLGHKPFLVLADHLTRAGIAVLRYDDRGTDESTGDHRAATSADFATDAATAFRFLREQDRIDAGRIGLIGHSEGGLIAPMVDGLVDGVAYLVLLAGPGVTGEEILLLQGELLRRAAGADDDAVAIGRQMQEQLFGLMRTVDDQEELAASMRTVMEEAAAAHSDLGDTVTDEIVESQLAQINSPWMRYFIPYDPRPAVRTVRCPILALNGTLDLQVWHEQNLDEIERVVTEAGGDVTIKRYEGLNHLFQRSETGSVSEYAMIETSFDEQLLEDVARWILERMTEGG